MSLKVWIQAARLRTLPLAVAGTVSGNLLAYAEKGTCDPIIFILSVLTAILLQVLSNYANDYGDFRNGADTSERTDRVMASGMVTEKNMRMAIGALISLCLVTGISLLALSIKTFDMSFWILLGMGIAGLFAAYYYTAGKNPYGYIGLGDLSVFIFFGLLSVIGTYYLQARTIESKAWWVAAAIGLLSVAVLNVNNIRDITSDASKNKMTIPVRIGYRNAMGYQAVLLNLAFFCFVIYSLYHPINTVFAMGFYTIFSIFIMLHMNFLRKAGMRQEYNKQLKFLSLLTFVFSLLFALIHV